MARSKQIMQAMSYPQNNGKRRMPSDLIGGSETVQTVTLAANGLEFTADAAGPETGELVLLLHGFPNSRHSWSEQLKVLGAAGYRAIAPDQRGYSPGARPAAIDSYHVDIIAGDAIALADALGYERFHLVGHDWGGQVAWVVASQYAARLRSLTVLSRPHPGAFAEAFREDPAQANRSRHHKAFQDAGMADRLLAEDAKAVRDTLCFERASSLFGKDEATAPPKRRMSDEMADRHLSVIGNRDAMDAALNWYRSAFAGGSTLAREGFPLINVPTLYLWGREDMSVGVMAATKTADHVPAGCTFVPIDGAGHFLAEEVPEQVNAALVAHVSHNAGV
jgi:pimeloyl-ACP methyl ester carboxylesterase